MKTHDFYYELPQELIAQIPLEDRSASRLMLLNRQNQSIEHNCFKNITDYLNAGDCLVLNDTRVIPARLYGKRADTGGGIEFLLLHKHSLDEWEVILKPGKRAKVGTIFEFGDGMLKAQVKKIVNDGNRIVKFIYDGIFEQVLDTLGEMPLPHYITHKLDDKERYQTVYSKNSGSAAAPTAGLHFTDELLDKIRQKGVKVEFVTLHVGLGTFRPVKAENVADHKMHSEFFVIDEKTATSVNETKKKCPEAKIYIWTGYLYEDLLDNNDFMMK